MNKGRTAARGLALVAILVTCGLGASPASAANWTAAEYPAVLEAGEATPHVLTLSESMEITCAWTTFKAELGKAVNELTVFPDYEGCNPILGQQTKITAGCDLGLVAKSTTEGTLNISCEGENAIFVDIGNLCRYKIASQGPLEEMGLENLGSAAGVEVITEVEKIAFTRTTSDFPFLCPAGGSATWTGTSIYEFTSKETSLAISGDVG